MHRLRYRVWQGQEKSRCYTDGVRAVKTPRFRAGDLFRVKKPGHIRKESPAFTPPVRILKQVGRWTHLFEDVGAWNATKLSIVAEPETITHKQKRPATRNDTLEQPTSSEAKRVPQSGTPSGGARCRHHDWQQTAAIPTQWLRQERRPHTQAAAATPMQRQQHRPHISRLL